jgi:hypothetical protein
LVGAIILLGLAAIFNLFNPPPQQQATASPATSLSSPAAAAALPKTSLAPKATVAPTAAPTAPPQLVSFAGQGDTVLRVPAGLQATPQLVTVTNSGGENFVVESLASDNSMQDLLVNTIGAYSGTTALNFRGETTTFLRVQSTGSWTVKLSDVTSARRFTTSVSGRGDDVVIYTGGTAVGTFDNSGGENFVVFEYPKGSPNLLVNTIGQYHGQQPLSGGPSVLVIQSTGNWSIAAQ